VTNSDIVHSYVGVLVQDKSDFGAIENFRGDMFYKQTLSIANLASSPTLRQRMDERAVEMSEFAAPMIESLLGGQRPDYGPLPWAGYHSMSIRFATDNGGTAKEGVGRTNVNSALECQLSIPLLRHHPPPSAWINAIAEVCRLAASCDSVRRAVSADACAVTTSV